MAAKAPDLTARLPQNTPIPVRACFVAERLHLRDLPDPPTGLGPHVQTVGEAGIAVLFRYGAVVLFNLSDAEYKAFLKDIHARMENPLRRLETEDTFVFVAGKLGEGVSTDGIGVHTLTLAHIQMIATILARSVALAFYEMTMAQAFDLVEPLARRLEKPRGGGRQLRQLLRHIGGALTVQHKLIGRVELQDKPELLWDHPELERLYLRLENEYELRPRGTVIERKLALISQTAQTAVNLLQNRSMMRVEWYIVGLIVFEVLLYGYDLWAKY
jgi:uncharacterized Rmd1/YagE family protein